MADSTLFDEGKVLVTVGLNEVMTKAVNPHVPYGPIEVARAAAECADAGAAGIHFHARFDDGQQDKSGDAIYRRAMELTAFSSDIVMWTTSYPLGADPTRVDDVPHQWALVDNPPHGAPLQFGCFDAFRIGPRPGWSPVERRFIRIGPDFDEQPSETYEAPPVLAEMLRRNLSPVFCCYDLADARWASCALAAEMLPNPTLVQLQMFASMTIGPSPTIASLAAFIAEARSASSPELSFVGFQFRTREEYEEMLTFAIQNGCHIRVGVGDAGHLYPTYTNADIVHRAVEIVRSLGYEPATPTDMRRRFLQGMSASTGSANNGT